MIDREERRLTCEYVHKYIYIKYSNGVPANKIRTRIMSWSSTIMAGMRPLLLWWWYGSSVMMAMMMMMIG